MFRGGVSGRGRKIKLEGQRDRRRQKGGKLLYCKAWQPRPVVTAAAVGGSAGWSETLGPHPTSHSPRLHPAHSPACGDESLSAACAPTTPAWTKNVKFNQRVHADVLLKKFLNISQFQDHLPWPADCSNTHTIWKFSHGLIKKTSPTSGSVYSLNFSGSGFKLNRFYPFIIYHLSLFFWFCFSESPFLQTVCWPLPLNSLTCQDLNFPGLKTGNPVFPVFFYGRHPINQQTSLASKAACHSTHTFLNTVSWNTAGHTKRSYRRRLPFFPLLSFRHFTEYAACLLQLADCTSAQTLSVV